MHRSPRAHPRHVQGTAEVALVLGLLEPAALTGGFARHPTRTLLAVLLPSAVAWICSEQLPAAQAFTSSCSPHRPAPPSEPIMHANRAHSLARDGHAAPRPRAEKKTIYRMAREEHRTNKTTTFTPTDLHDDQIGGDTCGCNRRRGRRSSSKFSSGCTTSERYQSHPAACSALNPSATQSAVRSLSAR
jgi:hypothetical protein